MCVRERETGRERIQCETCICESILAHLPKWSTILILVHVSAQSCMSLSQDKLLSSKGVRLLLCVDVGLKCLYVGSITNLIVEALKEVSDNYCFDPTFDSLNQAYLRFAFPGPVRTT